MTMNKGIGFAFVTALIFLLAGCESASDKDFVALDSVSKSGGAPINTVNAATEFIKKYPSDPRGYYARAGAFSDAGQPKLAEADYASAVKADPKYANGYYGLGGTFLDQGQLDLAEKNFDKAIELAKDSERKSAYLGGKAGLYAAKNDLTSSIETVKVALDTYEVGHLYYLLGIYSYRNQQFKEAETAWLKGMAQDKFPQPVFKPIINAALADYYAVQEKNYPKAKQYIEKALELDPSNSDYIQMFNALTEELKKS